MIFLFVSGLLATCVNVRFQTGGFNFQMIFAVSDFLPIQEYR